MTDLIDPGEVTADLRWSFFDANFKSFTPDKTLVSIGLVEGNCVQQIKCRTGGGEGGCTMHTSNTNHVFTPMYIHTASLLLGPSACVITQTPSGVCNILNYFWQ